MDLIRCPLYEAHIIPKKFLNHHLDGNCDAANNMLRKYFENGKYNYEIDSVPTNFFCHLPTTVLDNHNRKLLYLLLKERNEVKLEPISDGNDVASGPMEHGDNGYDDRSTPILDTQALARAADDLD